MAAAMDYEILPFLSLKSYCIPVHMRVIILGECMLRRTVRQWVIDITDYSTERIDSEEE